MLIFFENARFSYEIWNIELASDMDRFNYLYYENYIGWT